MPGILFVHGGDHLGEDIFRREGRGYWSQALPLVLEKYGYLSVTTAGPERLTDPCLFERYDAVLVARLPEGSWTKSLADRAVGGRAGVLAEGPLPAPVAHALGVQPAGPPCSHDGQLVVVDPRLQGAASAFGLVPRGRIVGPLGTPVTRTATLEWSALGTVPISRAQAAAWRERAWDVTRLRAGDRTEVLAEWRAHSERFPAVVRRGGLVGCAFGLFAFLGQIHTSEPFDAGEIRRTFSRPGVEAVALGLVDELHRHSAATRARILPWPAGKRWVRSVRHDVDRSLLPDQVSDVVARHARLGTHATWYWLARNATPDIVRMVTREQAHEVALHTERLWEPVSRDDLHTVEAAGEAPVRGTSAHGGAGSFRYQGAPNLLWADRHDFLYTELLQRRTFHPHRFPALDGDGHIRPLWPLCLPHHEPLDRSTRPGDVADERIRSTAEAWRDAGGLLQVMNHPDIHIPELFRVLSDISDEGCLDWTATEATDWWRRTHVRGELRLTSLGRGRFRVQTRQAAMGLVIELLQPDGSRVELALDLEPSRPTVVSPAGVVAS